MLHHGINQLLIDQSITSWVVKMHVCIQDGSWVGTEWPGHPEGFEDWVMDWRSNWKPNWKPKPPSECGVSEWGNVWVPNDVNKYMIHDSTPPPLGAEPCDAALIGLVSEGGHGIVHRGWKVMWPKHGCCYDLFHAWSWTCPCACSALDWPSTFHCGCAPCHVTSCDLLPSRASADTCKRIMVCMAPSGLCGFLTCPVDHHIV